MSGSSAIGPAGGAGVPSDGPAKAGSAGSWKVTLPCTKAQAEAIGDVDMPDAVLLATEEDEAAGRWRLDAYVEREPDADTLAAIRALVGDRGEPQVEALDDEDWVTLSQAGLEPIREGRFVVHTTAFSADPPPGGRAFLIEAGQAFGTGHHATTSGCLAMLDALAGERFGNVVDLGTGTGLLAFAARELWPGARVMATDIDPVAVTVTRENAELNGVERVDLLVADGTRDPAIAAGVPYDLVIANILAGPLIAMAAEITAIAAPGATVVLAGLLSAQADAVVEAYAACGCAETGRDVRGDWTILRLRAGAGAAGRATLEGNRTAWATDT